MPTSKKSQHLIKNVFIVVIRIYQILFSSDKGLLGLRQNKVCAFYPSCSEYAKQAVIKHGIVKGFLLAFKRILRCHPWQKNYYNPIT